MLAHDAIVGAVVALHIQIYIVATAGDTVAIVANGGCPVYAVDRAAYVHAGEISYTDVALCRRSRGLLGGCIRFCRSISDWDGRASIRCYRLRWLGRLRWPGRLTHDFLSRCGRLGFFAGSQLTGGYGGCALLTEDCDACATLALPPNQTEAGTIEVNTAKRVMRVTS